MMILNNMQWKTALTTIGEDGEVIRGYKTIDLIGQKSFVETIVLLWTGRLPSESETIMLNALFTASIDHGAGAPSATVARTVASSGNSLHTAVAAGVLTLGDLHGGAIEGAMMFFKRYAGEKNLEALAKKLKEDRVRVPGFGHKVLAIDKRSQKLFEVAKETGFYKQHSAFAEAFETALGAVSSKKLPINIDGAMAAIIADMGYDARLAKGFFMVGRLPGLVAHAYEQMISDEGIKRIDEADIEYIGESGKKL